MNLSNAVKQRIINIANERNMSIHKLAIKAGLPYSTVSSFLNGKCTSITLTTLLHICEASDMELKGFFDDKLFKNLELEVKEKVK